MNLSLSNVYFSFNKKETIMQMRVMILILSTLQICNTLELNMKKTIISFIKNIQTDRKVSCHPFHQWRSFWHTWDSWRWNISILILVSRTWKAYPFSLQYFVCKLTIARLESWTGNPDGPINEKSCLDN